jgi:hypothetical protein
MISTNRSGRPRDRLLALAGLITIAAAGALLAAGGAPAGAAGGPTTAFTGQITGGSGRYAHARGAVRLVLHAATAAAPAPSASPSPLAFTLTVTSPSCSGQHVAAPRRCLQLRGTLTGTALAARRLPDVGTTFALTGHGRLTPLGTVGATGTTSALGFIAHGRFPLKLRLSTPNGRLTITAQGPLVNGFHSPF